ncbi:DUF1345 domain-containing protein [Nocardia asteroides]|nr:DUF1345 domain-containing protein [Nocardia asteroides]UGT50942.1 DUF1345 domain-containing protein [Nocardia asteroides]
MVELAGMSRAVVWMLWILELSVTVLGLVWLLFYSWSGSGIGVLVVWNVLALAYIAAGWALLSRRLPDEPGLEFAGWWIGPRWYATMIALVASGSGLAAGMILVVAKSAAAEEPLTQGVSAATVLMSWLLLHTAFAQIYARAFFPGGGLQFPECAVPQLAEFVYFSFTIGTSFAVSDVSVVDRGMRRRVTAHSVLSFFFNAAVVAIAIDWLKG